MEAQNDRQLSAAKPRMAPAVLRIVLSYALFASLWILLSDRALEAMVSDPAARVQWSIFKGWAFVAVTATLLAFLLRREFLLLASAQTALRESEERLRLLGDNLPNSYVYQFVREKGGGTRFLHVSAGVERVHGVPAEAVLKDASLLHRQTAAEDLANMPALETATMQTDGHFAMELRFQRADGQWRWLQVLSRPRTGLGGMCVWDGVATDITDRKEAESAMRESEERFRAMATTITDGVVLINPQRRIYFFNAAAEKMFACVAPEVCGRELQALLKPGANQPRLDTVFDELMAAGQGNLPGKTFELVAQRRGGEEFPLEISLSTMCLRETTHIVGIMRDITERKRLEGQLSQALKMESVGQLAGGVAHDFNNILAVLMMQISLLKRDRGLSPALREPLEEMETEAKRAANLTRQLLLYSRRQVMQTQVLDMNALVDNLLKMLRRLLGEHIQISFARWAYPAWVEADSGMLEQVVTNLCVNARDAMPKGGQLRLGIRVREINPEEAKTNIEARPGTFACLSVSDNGCGMDEATLKRIFDPFFTTKEVGKGTGLGLATVYGIVKQHQGWIEVKSRLGEGTIFFVNLPASAPAEPAAARPSLPAETVAGGSETLLLVEDDRQVRRALSLFLRGQGYQVIEAGSGVEALRLWNLHQSTINLLLTDMVMPEGMTGLELADQLRGRKPGLKVIISSGYSSELLGPGGKLAANVLYLPKPCEATLLAKTVRECLDSPSVS